jgi:hypothetical protein
MSKKTIIFVILLFSLFFATRGFSAPYAQNSNLYVYQYQSAPSWYVSTASPGTLYTYAYPSSPIATVKLYTARYSFATANYWLQIINGQIYSGASYDGDNYEYRFTASGSGNGVSYTWSTTVDGFYMRTNGTGTVSFYIRFSATASNAALQNITLIVYVNGTQVGRVTASSSNTNSLSTGWGTASFSAVQAVYKVSFYLYTQSSITNNNVNCIVEVDALSVANTYLASYSDVSAALSYSSSMQSGLQTSVVYTASFQGANYSKLVALSPAPASYTYTSSSGASSAVTVTAYYNALTQSLSSGAVALPKPSGYNVLQYIARAPAGYYIVTNSSTPEYLDEAYAPGSASALQVTLVQPSWKTVYTLAQKYMFSVLNSSSVAVGSVVLPTGKYFVFVAKADPAQNCYLKLNSSLLYSASFLNNTVLSPPQAGTETITFSVQDYGAGYQVLQTSDLQGRIAGSGLIGSTGQVALNLTPYASYMVTVCKTGVCKSVGLVTISSSNIQLAVMPSVPAVTQPSWVSASYDYAGKVLRVNVSCASPPCTVSIYKSVNWYNYWQMRIPVNLNQGWNLVFLKKSSTPSASGMWAYVTVTDWSQIRFGDASGAPSSYLPYSIIWSNSTHAQVLVNAPQPGTYYLYWQSQIQVPAVNVSHPFYACYNGICGVRFNGLNQYAQSWVSKNWLTSNQSSVVWQFYVFPNQTAWDFTISPTDPRYQVLQGSIVSGQHYIPAGASGYVAQVSWTGISGAFAVLIRAYGSASASNVLRYELYRNGTLVASATAGVSTTAKDTSLRPSFLASPGDQYTLKIYFAGGVDTYIVQIYVFFNLGSSGFMSVSSYCPYLLGLAWSGVVNYIIDSSGTYRGMWSSLDRVGRLQTVTITVNNTLLATYYNSSVAKSQPYSYGIYQTSSYFRIGGTWYYYFYGLTARVLAYNRSLTASEVSAVSGGAVPGKGLLFYFVADPRYLYDINWDGVVDWQDLSGNGNHVQLVNFHTQGSFVNAPQRQPSNMLVITQTCNQQLCSYAIISDDPFFTVITSDASGKTAQASTGLSVPLWQSPLGSIVNTLGKTMNLDAFGVNINDFVILLFGLAVIYAAFTYRNWELALIVFGVWLTVGTLLLGGTGKLLVPGISLALVGAALSYMLKREQQP